jgi:hypothetical protein
MKSIIISLSVLLGATLTVNAQDRLVLRNGRTVEVNIQRSQNDRIEYTYPGETTVYERPKSAISAIYYEDGRKEILDESLKNKEVISRSETSSSGRNDVSRANSQTNSEGVFWQDVKTTFTAKDVNDLKRLQRVTATSKVSYKDAILQLKKKAAEIGATTVLVMDDPDNAAGEEIEVIGIAYRDDSAPAARPAAAATPPATPKERASTPAQTSSNTRRRRILQQMESYNNDSRLDLNSEEAEPVREQAAATNRNSPAKRAPEKDAADASDAIHLMNGRVIYGTIEELEPDDFVSIRTANGKVYEYSMDDVRRVQRGAAGKNSSRRADARTPSQQNAEYEYDENAAENASRQTRRPARSSAPASQPYGSTGGYKGIFDAGYTLPISIGEKGRFEVHTSHGYQINDYLFVGVGAGLHVYSARDINLKYSKIGTKENYPHYIAESTTEKGNYTLINPDPTTTWIHGVDSSFMTVPLFLDVRGYYPMNNTISPFVTFRLGYTFNLTDGFGSMGLYMNPAVGVKYSLSPKLGITASLGYSVQNYGGIPGKDQDGGYGFYYIKNTDKNGTPVRYEARAAGGITLKLGVEF